MRKEAWHRNMNKKRNSDSDEYNPDRLYTLHEHGISLNYDELLKQPGFKENLAELKRVGRAAIKAREERLRRNNTSGK